MKAELSNSIPGTERSLVGFTEDLDRVGIGVQRARDSGYKMFFLRQLFERLFDHRLAGARPADDETESALLAMDPERVIDFLLVTK